LPARAPGLLTPEGFSLAVSACAGTVGLPLVVATAG
jgi:hypothetical protein